MCGFGWHCAVSQLVCLQWMPYDDGFGHLCSAASDIAVTYVCSSPPVKPFQGKAMSVGNKHRPDPCNQCFSCSTTKHLPGGTANVAPWLAKQTQKISKITYWQRRILLVELCLVGLGIHVLLRDHTW